jgi:hypothetical protein
VLSELEIWTARGNSEMDVAQNKVSLMRAQPPIEANAGNAQHTSMSLISGLHRSHESDRMWIALKTVRIAFTSGDNPDIGFEPEIYFDKEEGFRCKRDENGNPLKPAFEARFESQPPVAGDS